MARLGDVCIINPKVPPIDDSMLVSFVPMQRVGKEGEFDPSEQRTYADVKKGFTYFADADVLFAKITPCMENGKGAIACGMENGIGFGSTEFHVLRPNKKMMMGEWLYYLTVCPTFRKEAERNMTGSAGQKRVPKSFLENYHVNIPVLSEQHQQVQVLNNIFALLSLRKQQLAKLDELVKSRFVEMFGDYDLSHTRSDWKTIFEIGKVVGGATPKTNIEEYWDGEYRWITPAELNADSGCIYDSVRKLTKAGVDSCSLQEMPIGTVILSSRAPIGKVAIAGNTFYCNQGFKNIICGNDVLPRYLYTVLLLNTDYLNSLGRGATFKEISKSIVENIKIPVPTMALQEQFAAFVAEADKSKLAVQQSIDQLETLKKSLMQKYFG